VEGVGVQDGILQLEAASNNFFITQNTGIANRLESAVDVLLGFIQVLYTACGFEKDVSHDWHTLRTKVPDLSGFLDIPSKLVGKGTGTDFWLLISSNVLELDCFHQFLGERAGFEQ